MLIELTAQRAARSTKQVRHEELLANYCLHIPEAVLGRNLHYRSYSGMNSQAEMYVCIYPLQLFNEMITCLANVWPYVSGELKLHLAMFYQMVMSTSIGDVRNKASLIHLLGMHNGGRLIET